MAGCRGVDNAQVDLLERELRQQEDYIYELEDYLMEYSEKLRYYRMACQAPSESTTPAVSSKRRTPPGQPELVIDPPRTAPAGSGRGAAAPSASPSVDESAPAGAAAEPSPQLQEGPDEVDPGTMEVPGLEIGDPDSGLHWQRADQIATTDVASDGDAIAAIIPDPADYLVDAEKPVEAETPPAPVAAVATEVQAAEPTLPPVVDEPRLSAARLEIRHVFSQPASAEGGSASLLVVVEAINAKDEPVEAHGKASIMVMGRDKSGALRRVDRWDFTAEETAAAWQTSRLGDGFHLQLPLGEAALPEEPLELWARLVDEEGGKLLTRLPFEAATLVAIQEAASEVETAETAVAVVESEPAEAAAVEPLPAPQWRASAEPAATGPRAEGFASTLGSQGSGWTTRRGEQGATGKAGAAGKAGASGKAPRVANGPALVPASPWRRGGTTTR
jgi:hypothetical protein